jgi:hypothetical protein
MVAADTKRLINVQKKMDQETRAFIGLLTQRLGAKKLESFKKKN